MKSAWTALTLILLVALAQGAAPDAEEGAGDKDDTEVNVETEGDAGGKVEKTDSTSKDEDKGDTKKSETEDLPKTINIVSGLWCTLNI